MIKISYRTLSAMTLPFTLALAHEEYLDYQEVLDKYACKVQVELDRIENFYSAFRETSLVCRFQAGEKELLLTEKEFQDIYSQVVAFRAISKGHFNPYYMGKFDPTGYVKGWAIEKIVKTILAPLAYIEGVYGLALNGGGDIQVFSHASKGFTWAIGIENPANHQEAIAKYDMGTGAVATSSLTKRGQHIISQSNDLLDQVTIVSDCLGVADMWATTGIAAGKDIFEEFIREHKLSGMYVYQGHLVFFEKGNLKT